MTPEEHDKMIRLCKMMEEEQDAAKLSQLADELNRFLIEVEQGTTPFLRIPRKKAVGE